MDGANTFLRQQYIQEFNSRFTVPAAQQGTAFVPVGGQALDRIFSIQHERTVNNDNTVRHANITLQIEPTLWRSTRAGCRVIVQERLDGTIVISYGPHELGRYTQDGQPIPELQRMSKPKRLKKPALNGVGAGFFLNKVTSAARSSSR